MTVDRNISDTRIYRFLGNLTAVSTNEVLVYPRTYAEPASQAQRSIVSTSAQDIDPGGTGAKQVRITYLDSNYVRSTEDILLNGTTPVNTVGLTIRFIESMKVVKGTFAVGAVSLMTGLAGGGSEIMAIPAATTESLACHHYVAAGETCWPIGWGSNMDKNCSFKLMYQDRINGNLVDYVADLEKMVKVAADSMDFYRTFNGGLFFNEKTYIRVTVVPGQSTSTVIRAWLELLTS